MQERRLCRSEDRDEALQLLVAELSRASGGRAVALIDDGGRLLAGAGRTGEVWAVAKGVTKEAIGDGPARAYIDAADESLRLAVPRHALGPAELKRAAVAVARILESTTATA